MNKQLENNLKSEKKIQFTYANDMLFAKHDQLEQTYLIRIRSSKAVLSFWFSKQ